MKLVCEDECKRQMFEAFASDAFGLKASVRFLYSLRHSIGHNLALEGKLA